MPFNNGQLPSIKDLLKNIIDDLNRFLLLILLILIIITIFINTFILDLFKFILLIIIIFRLFSKNKYNRTKENNKYLKIKRTILKPFTNIIRNIKESDKNIYKKCHKCKTTLKLPLPNKIGINHAKCPTCSNRVTIISLKKKPKEKIKVEVIKKK